MSIPSQSDGARSGATAGHDDSGYGESDVEMHLAYAEASVMLLESLMRLLVERRVISSDELMQEVENAIHTKRDMVAQNLHPRIAAIAAGVLARIGNSLEAL